MLMMSKRCSIAHSRPAISTAALPVYPAPSTRTLVSSHSGASIRTMPAHAVPCPQRSPASSSAITMPSSDFVTATERCTSPTSGWASSTPLSRMQTRTPAPVAPPQAHSRETSGGHGEWTRSASSAEAGRLQAGSSSSDSCASTVTGPILRSSLRLVTGLASDAQLVARCRAGDEAAWNELVERFSRYVFAISTQAFRLPQADAEDVFQEVFARVYQHLDRLRSDDAVRPWIAQLTRRLCIDRLRAGARESPADGDEIEAAEIDATLAGLDDALTVRAGLESIGEPCNEILDRFFSRDESYKTIGDALGIPAGTIASRISRCLGKLRTELEGRN